MFTKNIEIKVKRKADGKINLYSRCIGCCFKMLATIIEEEITD